jgi:repressor LexA
MRRFTERQREALTAMVWLREAFGAWPTARELAAALGITSTNAVRGHLRRLEAQGLVEHEPGEARSWRPRRPYMVEVGTGDVVPIDLRPVPRVAG